MSRYLRNQGVPVKEDPSKFAAGGDVKAYKACKCAKSKCLKLYCDCFARGVRSWLTLHLSIVFAGVLCWLQLRRLPQHGGSQRLAR